jgi:hypothetical protein
MIHYSMHEDTQQVPNSEVLDRRRFSAMLIAALVTGMKSSTRSETIPTTTPIPSSSQQPPRSVVSPDGVADISSIAYDGRNAISFGGHLLDSRVRYEGQHAVLTQTPWGNGSIRFAYNFHHAPHTQPIPHASVITLEQTMTPERRDHGDFGPIRTNEVAMVQAHPDVPIYLSDVTVHPMSDKILDAALFSPLFIAFIKDQFQSRGGYLAKNGALNRYILHGYITIMGRIAGHNSKLASLHKLSAALQKAGDEIPSPDQVLLLTLRNHLAAEKNHWLGMHIAEQARAESKETPTHLVSMWGAGHSGIESTTLKTSAERIEFLSKWKWLILQLFSTSEDAHELYTCPKVEVQNGRYRQTDLIEIPTLKALFSPERTAN